jgi:hypothetical protein
LRELARREGISINQFVSTAVAEKLAALMTCEYLQERASRGDRARFEAVLAKVPDAPAATDDTLDRNER